MQKDYMPILFGVLELVGGYFGFMGLGWVAAGKIRQGLILLIGYGALLALGAALTFLSFGCLGFIFGPLHIIVPLISAIKIYELVR